MSQSVQPVPYASPQVLGTCPLCRIRPASKRTIYAHSVCKKCFNAFANRRQLGYLFDALIFNVPLSFVAFFGIRQLMASNSVDELTAQILISVFGAVTTALFLFKDGFSGQSPGKRLAGVVVLDEETGQPIGFARSFKRHAVLLFGLIPFVGGVVSLVLILIIAVQVGKGYRLGDRFAKTKSIWKKYADSHVFGGTALRCETCGYELAGNVSGTCPECGVPVSAPNLARLDAAAAQAVAPQS